ncbi:MAG: tetratricopeptide repeat protein [Alphaproteobacteria bacterium]
MHRIACGSPPARPLARRIAHAISMGHYQRSLVLALGLSLGLTLGLSACAEDFLPPAGADRAAGPILIAAAGGQVASDALPLGGSPYGSYLAGLYAGSQRDLSMAADFMLESLAYDPDNEQLLNRAFMLVAGDGRHAEAVDLGRRIVAHRPEHGLAALALAVDAIARDAPEEGAAAMAKLPEKGLSTVTVPLVGAWLQIAKGDVDAALDKAAPLKDKSGFSVFHGLHLALMLDVGGREAAAREAYDTVLQLAGEPTLRLALVAGNFFERSGDADRAREVYQSFLERDPDSLLVTAAVQRVDAGEVPEPEVANAAEGVAEALFNLASLLSKERAEEIALIHAHLALRLKPDFSIARILIGEILQSQNRSREAIAAYRAVPEDSPFSWMVRLRVAEELERLDATEEAAAELEGLAASRPDRFEPLLRLGNMLRAKERFEDAAAAYDRAIERVAEPRREHWTMFYFRGIARERTESWPQAEADFLQALDLEPEQPFVMNYLAYSWIEKKLHLDRAKAMLVRAVELRPDDGYIVDSLGWVYFRLGEYNKGVRYLERAVELRSQDPVINDHLGDAYWRVGRRQEARFQWRRALSLGPEEAEAPVIEKKIYDGLGATPEDI